MANVNFNRNEIGRGEEMCLMGSIKHVGKQRLLEVFKKNKNKCVIF